MNRIMCRSSTYADMLGALGVQEAALSLLFTMPPHQSFLFKCSVLWFFNLLHYNKNFYIFNHKVIRIIGIVRIAPGLNPYFISSNF